MSSIPTATPNSTSLAPGNLSDPKEAFALVLQLINPEQVK